MGSREEGRDAPVVTSRRTLVRQEEDHPLHLTADGGVEFLPEPQAGSRQEVPRMLEQDDDVLRRNHSFEAVVAGEARIESVQ